MRLGILFTSVLLGACATQVAIVPGATATVMGGTSWQFTEPGVGLIRSTFDANGRFRAEHDGKVIETGKWTAVNGKLCEDDDATPDATLTCYSLGPVMPAIGGSMPVTSDKGQSFVVTRVAYAGPRG